jgi:hypothetical protein
LIASINVTAWYGLDRNFWSCIKAIANLAGPRQQRNGSSGNTFWSNVLLVNKSTYFHGTFVVKHINKAIKLLLLPVA